MIRGTTPTHIVNLPFAASQVSKVRIYYEQDGELILEKTEKDCTLADSSLSVTLTQEDTLKFKADKNVCVQVKVLTTGGEAPATKAKYIPVDRILKDEVLT